MLKESYSKIVFPLVDKDPDTVFKLYTREFNLSDVVTLTELSTIFMHGLRDYLEGNIDEWGFGSLCFALVATKKKQDILNEADNKLRNYIHDCADIMWLSEGQNFSKYKKELSNYFEELKSTL